MQIHTAMTDIAGQFYSIMELNVHPDIGSTIGRRARAPTTVFGGSDLEDYVLNYEWTIRVDPSAE